MTPSINARFIAKVLGVPAVMGVAIVGFVWLTTDIASADIPNWLKVTFVSLYAPVLIGVSWRLIRGGEQGPTDIVITETAETRTITLSNVPLSSTSSELPR